MFKDMLKDIEVTTFMINDDIERVVKNDIPDRYDQGHLRYGITFKSGIRCFITLDLYTKQINISNDYKNEEQKEFARKEFAKYGVMPKNTKYGIQHVFKYCPANVERTTKIFLVAVKIEDMLKQGI